jgi:3-phenylpropionate/trans-cinnamate dioxygenase ferredoxin component
MAVHKVAKKKDLPPGNARAIEVAGRSIAMFNVDGVLYAIDNDCTHDGGPLSEGVITDKCVVCPWHGAEFDLVTGKALTPPAVEDVRIYKAFISGDDVCLEIG